MSSASSRRFSTSRASSCQQTRHASTSSSLARCLRMHLYTTREGVRVHVMNVHPAAQPPRHPATQPHRHTATQPPRHLATQPPSHPATQQPSVSHLCEGSGSVSRDRVASSYAHVPEGTAIAKLILSMSTPAKGDGKVVMINTAKHSTAWNVDEQMLCPSTQAPLS